MFPINSYQVQEQDKDLLTLAENLGLNYQQLQVANPDITSISTGQYISLPAAAPLKSPKTLGGDKWWKPPTAPTVNPALPKPPSVIPPGSGPAVMQTTNTKGDRWWEDPATQTPNSATVNANITSIDMAMQTNDPSKMPLNISTKDLQAMGYTMGQIMDTGLYTFNASTNTFVKNKNNSANPQYGATDALKGTPGHYYVDDKTQAMLGKTIVVNGKRRLLLADKNGRLYYGKPQGRRRDRAIVDTPRVDAPSTTLGVILGS